MIFATNKNTVTICKSNNEKKFINKRISLKLKKNSFILSPKKKTQWRNKCQPSTRLSGEIIICNLERNALWNLYEWRRYLISIFPVEPFDWLHFTLYYFNGRMILNFSLISNIVRKWFLIFFFLICNKNLLSNFTIKIRVHRFLVFDVYQYWNVSGKLKFLFSEHFKSKIISGFYIF